MTEPATGPQPLLRADVARAVAQHVLNSDPATRRLTPDLRIPAETYVEAAIQDGARRGSHNAFLYVYEGLERQDERIQAVRAHLAVHGSDGAQAAPVADRLAAQALESAGWLNERVPADVRTQLQDYVGKTIQDTANDAHAVVLDWAGGKVDDRTLALDQHMNAYQVNNVFAGLEDARLATRSRPGALEGERANPATQPAKSAGHEQGQG